MTGNLVFTLCVPADYQWADKLVKRLIANEYNVYLESPDQQNSQQTTAALEKAHLMLVIVSQESALGESAEVFEDWWRPFAKQGRSMIIAVKKGEPAGVEHWMPFDLRTFPLVNFNRSDAYSSLCKQIDALLSPNVVPEAPPALPAPSVTNTGVKPPSPPQRVHSRSQLPPMPTARASHAMEQAVSRRRERRLWRILLLGPVVFVLLIALWLAGLMLADVHGSSMALLMVTVSVMVSTIVTLAVMAMRGRRSDRPLPGKHDIHSGIRSRRLRPDIYLEVISSVNEEELGNVFAIDRPRLSIGKAKQDDIRIRDRKIDKEHAILFYSHTEGNYYIENQSNRPTVVHDRVLQRGDVSVIENGDLIILGDSAVLQFRTI